MSYIDDHVDWMRSNGVVVLSEFSAELHGEFRPQHDLGPAKGLPSDVAAWYEAGLCGRVSGNAIVGGKPAAGDGGAYLLCREEADNSIISMPPELLSDWREAGRYPKDPVPFVCVEHQELVLETHGARAGWVYAAWLEAGSGPIATSIPQYLLAVRGLVDAGLLSLDMAEEPDWQSDDLLASSALAPSPPEDTPGVFVGFDAMPLGAVKDLLRSFVTFGPPIAESICDLVPGFEVVTMDYDPDDWL